MNPIALEFQSALAAPREQVWQSVTSIAGINREVMPVFRMTAPPGLATLAGISFTPGEPLFRSRIYAFGFVPIDWSDLTLVSLDPGSGFLERSAMGSMQSWEHERRIADLDGGCFLTDRLSFVPRLPRPVAKAMIALAFRNRHRNLRRMFGQLDNQRAG